eukprot:TRINITY_DN34564_c0_g1_i1.p1 TRINITY_DN34564_c0_g1~~TRINITY_DN34564_c0_g1_i1.p1  ORF type:complete len:168 (-),score=25.30 TRINITY_DN34564_c0_g1_i1:86-589(-)
MMVEQKKTRLLYAMKSLRKEIIIEKDQLEHIKSERQILAELQHPFLVNLEYAFQTPEKLFMIMPFKRGGELFEHLKTSKRFPEPRARFYLIEIILGLEYLHSKNIVYRDLKPENLLLDEEGHIALTDFGLAKFVKNNQLITTFAGTPEYLAPEILNNQPFDGKTADW